MEPMSNPSQTSGQGPPSDPPAGSRPHVAHPEPRWELHRVLAALGDPVRLDIVRQLAARGEVPCGGFNFGLAKSTLSHHFKVLRESGVVASRPEGTSLLNYINRNELEQQFPGLLDGVLGAEPPAKRAGH